MCSPYNSCFLWLLQLQLCVSTSSWSDGFSLDTVGSYGCVRCPANNMDFLVTRNMALLFWIINLLLHLRFSDSHILFILVVYW